MGYYACFGKDVGIKLWSQHRDDQIDSQGKSTILCCTCRWDLWRCKSLVDHSFTTDRRGNNGDCALRKFWKQHCSEQKRLKTNGNYCKNHQKSVGKDEVGSSNLPSSSKKSWNLNGFGTFALDENLEVAKKPWENLELKRDGRHIQCLPSLSVSFYLGITVCFGVKHFGGSTLIVFW